MTHFVDLSTKLVKLVTEEGPLRTSSVDTAFKRRFGEPIDLQGCTLNQCMSEGLVLGVVYKKLQGHMCLVISPGNKKLLKRPESPSPMVEENTAQGGEQWGGEGAGARCTTYLTTPSRITKSVSPTTCCIVISNQSAYRKALETIIPNATEGGVDTLEQAFLGLAVALNVVGWDLVGAENGSITHIQVAPGPSAMLIFDVQGLERTRPGEKIIHTDLLGMLNNCGIMKVMHDAARTVFLLKRHFGPELELKPVLDTQLAYEALGHGVFGSLDTTMKYFSGLARSCRDKNTLGRHSGATNYNITRIMRQPAATAISLAKAFNTIQHELTCKYKLQNVLNASQRRANFAAERLIGDRQRMTFCNHGASWGGGTGRRLISVELKTVSIQSMEKNYNTSKTGEKAYRERSAVQIQTHAPVDNTSIDGAMRAEIMGQADYETERALEENFNSSLGVLKLVPQKFLHEWLSKRHTENLRNLHELVLDEGARPRAYLEGQGRVYLCSDEDVVVTQEDIYNIVGELDRDGSIGSDNRAGFPGQLHRLSVMRDKRGCIYGVTLRIGRCFKGSSEIIDDLLFYPIDSSEHAPRKAPSLLILGEPGSGKTTVIRDICRKISTSQTVVIVDTSNEIAGDGAIPHREAIGESRRLMVANKDHQHRVMIEALQNHTPQTIVVDEISNSLEAKACMDIKARGVRIVASAHGDLQSLLSNPTMNTLVGGKENITLGDSLAQKTNRGQKVLIQRAGSPTFDTVIELQRGKVNTWTIIQNVGLAVDDILENRPYGVQRRIRIEDDHQTADCCGASFFMKLDREAKKTAVYYNLRW